MRAWTLWLGLLAVLAVVGVVPSLRAEPAALHYAFVSAADHPEPTQALLDAVEVPEGFARVAVAEGSLPAWLRSLPLRTDRRDVRTFDGRVVAAPARAVVALDVGRRDLQQCADTALRLVAEYAFQRGTARALSFTFTSGDRSSYAEWVGGERIAVSGSRVVRRAGAPRADDHASLRAWLDQLFTYAGTHSLARDAATVQGLVLAGDVFVQAGSPGHAVVVLDVAQDHRGRRVALLGQGFMPAQELHVLEARSPSTSVLDGVWFLLPERPEDELRTPSWPAFSRQDARRLL